MDTRRRKKRMDEMEHGIKRPIDESSLQGRNEGLVNLWRGIVTPAELMDEFSIKIYESPLCEMRDDGRIGESSNPVAVLMLIVDFETEVSMNGINNFLGNSSGRYGKETVAALKIIGAHNQAALLERILAVAEEAGMTHDAIQRERSGLDEYAVVSFHEVHGSKWDKASDKICDLESEIDYSGIWSCAEEFVREHSNEFHQALN